MFQDNFCEKMKIFNFQFHGKFLAISRSSTRTSKCLLREPTHVNFLYLTTIFVTRKILRTIKGTEMVRTIVLRGNFQQGAQIYKKLRLRLREKNKNPFAGARLHC